MAHDYLVHYGVKGMKWGVRKSRPRSGMTRKQRKGIKKAAKTRRERRKAMDRRTSARYTYKKRALLDDNELRVRINRLQMEKQLKDLSKNDKSILTYPVRSISNEWKSIVEPGRNSAQKALSMYGAKVVVANTVGPEAAAFIRPKK